MVTPVQLVACPKSGNVQNVPVGQGAGQFSWELAGRLATTTSASASITTTDTVIAGGSAGIQLPANTLLAGQVFRFRLFGVCTCTVSQAVNVKLRFGAAGTTSDAQFAHFQLTATATGTSIGFCLEIDIVILTTGSTGTVAGVYVLQNTGSTGLGSTDVITATITNDSALNTTIAGYFSASVATSNANASLTFKPPCTVEAAL